MTISANFRALSRTLFKKTAQLASVALIASLLVAGPLGASPASGEVSMVASDSISVGSSHACAVVDGGVKCWGDNNYGQLGIAGVYESSTAVDAIIAGSGATQVSVGARHSCALFENHSVKCWGMDADNFTPVAVAGLSGVMQVSVGSFHSCAVVNGGVKCWGEGLNGRLGNANNQSSWTPVDAIAARSGVTQLSAGDSHSCAVFENGSIKCWGFNLDGQLGNDSTALESWEPVAVVSGSSGTPITGATKVSAGASHTCAIISGAVKCWGDNQSGQLGTGNSVSARMPLSVLSASQGVTSISAGDDHSCATLSGILKCWGGNSDGQLGVGTTSDFFAPLRVLGLNETVGSFDAGGQTTCAALGNQVKCWGANWSGKLGNGDLLSSSSPISAFGMADVSVLGAGQNFTCALSNGAVLCWGNNKHGQLGDGTTNASTLPVVAIAGGATLLTVGPYHVCALVDNGDDGGEDVWCWGDNEYGQLGNGIAEEDTHDLPKTVTGLIGLTGITDLAAGREHTCAVVHGGVKCWGASSKGQLGNRTDEDSLTPVDVISGPFAAPITGATQVSAGDRHSCAVFEGGSIKCWGDNSDGQLGNNSTVESWGPVAVVTSSSDTPASITGATKVSAGAGHTCAVISGVVKCWGNNVDGQLGLLAGNTSGISATPVQSFGSDGIANVVETGDSSTCAIIDGGVKCLGLNDEGQLGDGTLTFSNVPRAVMGLAAGVQMLAVGASHTCALTSASVVACWGSNQSGALGSARAVTSALPVTVVGVYSRASVILEPGTNLTSSPQTSTVDHTSLLKPEITKQNRVAVLKTGQRVTLSGANLSNVQSVLVGAKAAKIIWSSGSEMMIEVPANLSGSPVVTLVSKSGLQNIDGLLQIIQPYKARSVKVTGFKGNSLNKAAALAIRKSYLRESSVNTVVCAAVIGKGATAKTKAATIAKSVSACNLVSGYSVKFSEFKIAVRTLKTPLKTPYVSVTFDRTSAVLVN